LANSPLFFNSSFVLFRNRQFVFPITTLLFSSLPPGVQAGNVFNFYFEELFPLASLSGSELLLDTRFSLLPCRPTRLILVIDRVFLVDLSHIFFFFHSLVVLPFLIKTMINRVFFSDLGSSFLFLSLFLSLLTRIFPR